MSGYDETPPYREDEAGLAWKSTLSSHWPLFVMAAIPPYGGFIILGGSAAFLELNEENPHVSDQVKEEATVTMIFGAVMSLVHIVALGAWVLL